MVTKRCHPWTPRRCLLPALVVAIAHGHHVGQHLVLFVGVVAALAVPTTLIPLRVEVLVANSDLLHG